ncbi:MAG: LacI family DNA-binding transcriptional regulator [Gammaproteobacteria bacterium]|nr:LacI family DNA-binding transcriptional regulator [Gammaproteobacteria bacterium]
MRPTARRRRGRHGATIAEVAQRAGVSGMTVSRVLSGAAPVSPVTQERVRRAVRELGYRPNAAARQLASGAAHRIGLVYSNPSQAYLGELLLGALEECAAHGLQLVLARAGGPARRWQELAALLTDGVDAFLLPPAICDEPRLLGLLQRASARWVALSPADPNTHALSVSVDDFEAARRLTAHLVALGHTHIGCIAGDPAYRAATDRCAGYLRALADAGLPPGPMEQGYFSFRSGVEATTRLLAIRPRCTALFASNDDMAAGALAAAARSGLLVPRELSIVGFDDTPIGASIAPAITTMRQPIAQLARTAVQLLRHAHRTPDAVAAVGRTLHCRLIERDSCSRPHGGHGSSPAPRKRRRR